MGKTATTATTSLPGNQGQKFPGTTPATSAEERTRAHSKFFTGIRNGLWAPKHEARMGKSVWLFGWLIGKQTGQNGSAGMVLGGKVLTWEWIAQESGWPLRTLKRWAATLRRGGYIYITQTQHGVILGIRNAKKFAGIQPSLFPEEAAARSGPLGSGPDTKTGPLETKTGPLGVPILLMKSKGECDGRTRAKSTRSSIPSLAYDFQKLAEESWTLHYEGAKPTWGRAEFTVLARVANSHRELGLEALGCVWGNFLGSTDRFITDRGHNPKDFWSHFDRVRRGPILQTGGKPDAQSRTRANIAAVEEFLRRDREVDGNLRRSLSPASWRRTDRYL